MLYSSLITVNLVREIKLTYKLHISEMVTFHSANTAASQTLLHSAFYPKILNRPEIFLPLETHGCL